MKVFCFLPLSLYIVGASAELDPCLRFCAINHRPVCATNGICIYEFKNKCLMANTNCDNKKLNLPEFTPIHMALCYKPDNTCHPEDVLGE